MGAGIHTDTPKSHSLCEWTKFLYNCFLVFCWWATLPITDSAFQKPSLKSFRFVSWRPCPTTVKVTGYAISVVCDRSHSSQKVSIRDAKKTHGDWRSAQIWFVGLCLATRKQLLQLLFADRLILMWMCFLFSLWGVPAYVLMQAVAHTFPS